MRRSRRLAGRGLLDERYAQTCCAGGQRRTCDLDRAVAAVQDAVAPFAPRPHWGKVFHADRFSARDTYEMFDDFVDMTQRLDPHGVFRNAWWDRHIG